MLEMLEQFGRVHFGDCSSSQSRGLGTGTSKSLDADTITSSTMPVFSQLGDFTPRRVVSLQPSITSTLERLGLLDRMVACTKYCAQICPAVRDREIAIIEDSWTADSDQIRAVKPDLVIASVPYQVEAVTEILKSGAQFLGLAPRTLDDVYAAIAGIMNEPNRGQYLIREMQMEIERVYSRNATPRDRPRVYCEEWGKPLI